MWQNTLGSEALVNVSSVLAGLHVVRKSGAQDAIER